MGILYKKKKLNDLFETFFNYYEFTIQEMDVSKIPEELINQLHYYNTIIQPGEVDIRLWSGSENYRNIDIIRDWTTDLNTADRFANEDGFIVGISFRGFSRRFDFVSMDVINDYLLKNKKYLSPANKEKLQDYISESEVYAIKLKTT